MLKANIKRPLCKLHRGLLARQQDGCRACSRGASPFSALLLLMLGVFANHHYAALALDDLALLTNGLYRGTYLHVRFLLIGGRRQANPRNALASSCCAT